MKKNNYESFLDAFRELSSVTDDEILTPQVKKLVKEGKEFSLRYSEDDLTDAKNILNDTDRDTELEVIDINADTLEHIKDKKDYVGQVIIQCERCRANRFIDMENLVVSETDPEIYNVEDECPNCHSSGDGFEIIGQVGKVPTEEPETKEVVPEQETNDINIDAEIENEDEIKFENSDKNSDEPVFENDYIEDDVKEETNTQEDDSSDIDGAAEELDYFEEEEPDGTTTTESEDDIDDLELPQLGDEFDPDNVRPDDTSDDIEIDIPTDKEEEPEDEAEYKPVKRKLKLPTREALERAKKARCSITEELLHKVILPESIDKVIITKGKKKVFEGLVEELPEDIIKGNLKGFNVANGYLMCNIDPVTVDVDTPLAKVLNCFDDDETIKIIVWDVDTSEELLQGCKSDVLKKFGHCQLVSLDAPKVLCIELKGNACDCADGECTCDVDDEMTPEEQLCPDIFKAHDLAKYNADDPRSEEFWICESIYNKEDLEHIYERYIKDISDELVEKFKQVTGYRDELDEMCDKYGVTPVKKTVTNESLNGKEFDELIELAKKIGLNTLGDLQDFARRNGNLKDRDLLIALRNEANKRERINVNTENLTEQFTVKSFKTRKELSEALEKIKEANIQYKVRRSNTDGYRYDLIYENINKDLDDDLTEDEYIEQAKKFAKEIRSFSLAKCENLYYDDYGFDKNDPEDEAEKIIADALSARIKQLTGKTPQEQAEEEADYEEYIKNAKEFAKRISNYSLAKCEELYYDDYNFDAVAPEDEAEKIIADALIARIKEITDKEPVIPGVAVNEDFEIEELSDDEYEDDTDVFETELSENLEEELIKPAEDESEQEFVSRFVKNKKAIKEFPNLKQRLAVAYSRYNAKKNVNETYDENTGDDFKDNIAFLTNDELEAIAGYKSVIEYFKEKGIDEDKIMDRLEELLRDEEEHLDELKELYKAITGEDMSEIGDDSFPEAEKEVDPAELEAPVDESLTETINIKPFFTPVEEEPQEVEFDTDVFDEDLNKYFDEAYDDTVIYNTEHGLIDKKGNIMLEGIARSDKGEINITFKLTPTT